MSFDWQTAAAAAGPIASSAANAYNQVKTNRVQLELSRTAHQREVRDLRAAGLNPILSAGGRGAPMPNLQAPQVYGGAAVNAALSAKQNASTIALQNATTQKTLAEANSAQTAAKLNDQSYWFNYHTAEANAALKLNEVFKSDVEVDNGVLAAYKQSLLDQYSTAHSGAAAARLQLPQLQAEAKMYASPLGKYVPYINSAKAARGIFGGLRLYSP